MQDQVRVAITTATYRLGKLYAAQGFEQAQVVQYEVSASALEELLMQRARPDCGDTPEAEADKDESCVADASTRLPNPGRSLGYFRLEDARLAAYAAARAHAKLQDLEAPRLAAAYVRAAKAAPQHAPSLVHLGNLLLHTTGLPEELTALREAAGEVCEDAEACYRKVLELEPTNHEVATTCVSSRAVLRPQQPRLLLLWVARP